jgi:hypothetical protein
MPLPTSRAALGEPLHDASFGVGCLRSLKVPARAIVAARLQLGVRLVENLAMDFGHRTAERVKTAIAVTAIYSVVVALLAQFLPAPGVSFPEAFLRWFVGIPATLAVWFCAEWLCTAALSLPFWSRMPSWARIALLVLIVVAAISMAFAVSAWWRARSAA